MKTILLTGASGVVGSSVLNELLKVDDCRVFLLLRASRNQNIDERKRSILTFLGYSQDDARVTAIAGDITLPHLGMDPADEQRLQSMLTHAVHCAASLSLDISREDSFRHSIESVKHVLHFLSSVPQCKLDYVSTVGVKGRSLEPLPEERVTPRREFFNAYEEGKYLAEIEIYQAMDRGMAVTIHRPGMIVGHSESGKIIHFQVFYHLLKLICGRSTAGFVPQVEDVKIDTVPCDLVGRAIAESVLRPQTAGKIIHLCSGFDEAISIGELQRMVIAAFEQQGLKPNPIRAIPLVFLRMGMVVLRTFLRGSAAKKFDLLPQFLEYAQVEQKFENTKSRQWIESLGIKWLSPRQYLPVCLEEYARQSVLRGKGW